MFKQEIEQLRRAKIQKKFPTHSNEWIDRIWYGSAIKYTKGKSAPGVEKNIVEFLQLSGHQAEKRSVSGRQINKPDVKTSLGTIRGKSTYIPSTGTKGSADISAIIYSISVAIEVKLGKDRQSAYQKKYEQAVSKAGGVYFIAKDEDDFLVKYKEFLELPQVKLMRDFTEQQRIISE